MWSVLFGFGGRIGRLNYLGATLALAAVLTFLCFTFVLTALSQFGPGSSGRDGASTVHMIGSVVTTGLYVWFTLALMAKRFRDIGWDPFVVIVGWGALSVLDTCAAHYVPAYALAGGAQTAFGLLLGLAMVACLLFWPGNGDGDAPDLAALPRATRVAALSAPGGAGGAMSGSPGRR